MGLTLLTTLLYTYWSGFFGGSWALSSAMWAFVLMCYRLIFAMPIHGLLTRFFFGQYVVLLGFLTKRCLWRSGEFIDERGSREVGIKTIGLLVGLFVTVFWIDLFVTFPYKNLISAALVALLLVIYLFLVRCDEICVCLKERDFSYKGLIYWLMLHLAIGLVIIYLSQFLHLFRIYNICTWLSPFWVTFIACVALTIYVGFLIIFTNLPKKKSSK